MLKKGKKETEKDPYLRLLEEWLPKLSKGKRAYLKGASEALFYAQEKNLAISNRAEQDEKEKNNK